MPNSSPYHRHARLCIPCVDPYATRSPSPRNPETIAPSPVHEENDASLTTERILGRKRLSYKWNQVKYLGDETPAPKHRWSFASCSDGENVYIQGGVGLNESYWDFWKFNWKTKRWSEIVPNNMTGVSAWTSHRLPLLREHIMIMYKNRIFIFGGNLVDTTSVPLWCFDLLTSEWVSLCSRGPLYSVSDHVVDSKSTASTTPLSHSQVPSNLTQHSAVLYNQAIFIFGGYRHVYGVSGELWKYDLEKNLWQILYVPKRNQKGPKGISGHRAVLYDDAMFVIFGRKRENELSNEMWKYSFESHAWSCEKQQGQLPPNLTGAAVEVVGKRLFVVGGKTEDASFNKSLYLFSFAKRRWYKYGVDSEHTALSEATLISVPLALVSYSPRKAAIDNSKRHEITSDLINFGNSTDSFVKVMSTNALKDEHGVKRVFFKQNSMFETKALEASFGGLHSAEDLTKLSMTRMSRSITSIDDTDHSKDCHPFQYHLLSSASTLFQSLDSLASPGTNSAKLLGFAATETPSNNSHFTYDNQSFLNDSFDNPLLYKQTKNALPSYEEARDDELSKTIETSENYEEALVLFGGLCKDYFPGQKNHMEILYCTVPSIIGNNSKQSETYV